MSGKYSFSNGAGLFSPFCSDFEEFSRSDSRTGLSAFSESGRSDIGSGTVSVTGSGTSSLRLWSL